jgi:hypothetical protein
MVHGVWGMGHGAWCMVYGMCERGGAGRGERGDAAMQIDAHAVSEDGIRLDFRGASPASSFTKTVSESRGRRLVVFPHLSTGARPPVNATQPAASQIVGAISRVFTNSVTT